MVTIAGHKWPLVIANFETDFIFELSVANYIGMAVIIHAHIKARSQLKIICVGTHILVQVTR